MIGGAALLHRGLKEVTKDIDVVVSPREEFIHLQHVLATNNFITKSPTNVYKNMNLSEIYVRDDYRIDIFAERVCGKFSLSKEMQQRAETIYEYDMLTVHICSNEDILLFKSMTEREGDIDDCIEIAKTTPDWTIIIDELKAQASSGEQVWITWVAERLDLLAEKGVYIPILKELHKLVDDYYDSLRP